MLDFRARNAIRDLERRVAALERDVRLLQEAMDIMTQVHERMGKARLDTAVNVVEATRLYADRIMHDHERREHDELNHNGHTDKHEREDGQDEKT
jgi:hypothetical protein